MRIGSGYDVHCLVSGRKLVIGGITIDHDKGLDGHSDADVLVHAICDALLGAAGLGDIGTHFPDTSNEFKNIDSLKLLERVCHKINSLQYNIANIDATIIAQAPKMAPHIPWMKKKIAATMTIDLNRINIKATTTEKLGPMGRGEGIAASCVALIE